MKFLALSAQAYNNAHFTTPWYAKKTLNLLQAFNSENVMQDNIWLISMFAHPYHA